MADNHHSRDGFKSRWGFILACIGSAVGMANIWRFPWMVSTYGGMTFLASHIAENRLGESKEFVLPPCSEQSYDSFQ